MAGEGLLSLSLTCRHKNNRAKSKYGISIYSNITREQAKSLPIMYLKQGFPRKNMLKRTLRVLGEQLTRIENKQFEER